MNPEKIKIGHIVLPNKPLTNDELIRAAKELKIPNFRGVYLRDTLPKKPKLEECGIFNLDDFFGSGTHWVCWWKRRDKAYYFDSFGLSPPIEFIDYIHPNKNIFYNTEQIQPRDQIFCGHLCLYVLKEMTKDGNLQRIINDLY